MVNSRSLHSGRDDTSVWGLGFEQGKFGAADGRTADPSAALGMTKERATLPFKCDSADDEQRVPRLRYASVQMTLLFEG